MTEKELMQLLKDNHDLLKEYLKGLLFEIERDEALERAKNLYKIKNEKEDEII